jgi:hypothetical protein
LSMSIFLIKPRSMVTPNPTRPAVTLPIFRILENGEGREGRINVLFAGLSYGEREKASSGNDKM